MTDKLIETPIREAWARVKPRLEEIRKKYDTNWLPEDVYAECLKETAFLYEGPEGFIILVPQDDEYSLEKELLIWIVWGNGADLQEKYLPQIEKLAKELGATSLVMRSPRTGFIKKGYWDIALITYKRQLCCEQKEEKDQA